MGLFNCVYLRTPALLFLLVCSSLSVANGKEIHPVLKCNSYADMKDRGWEKFSRGREAPFTLQVTRTEYINEIWFQYRVELYAAEQDRKFQGFLIQAHHPTDINLSNSKTLMKGAGFVTSPGSEWEPVTCQTTNPLGFFNTVSDDVSIQDSAINTTSSLKEYIHLTWETPSSGIPTKFWYIVQDENGYFHRSTQEINLHPEGFTRRSRMRRSSSNGGMGPGRGHCTYDVPDSDSSTGSCVAAGYNQCCPGTVSTCVTASCFCDEACFDLGDCCRDVNELNCTCNRTLPTITRGLDEHYRVQLRNRLSFECEFHGVPIPNIVWLKDTSLDLSNVDDSNLVIVHPEPASSKAKSTLTILEVSLQYRGTYTCLATNNAGSSSSTGILSIVDRVLLNLEEPHDNMSTDGENVTLNCAVHSNLVHSLTWLHTSRNGTTSVVNGHMSQLTMTTTDMLNVTYHFLTIDSVEYTDAGNYTCVAMLGVDSISSTAYLSVSVPAEVQVHGHNTVTEFESLVISCKAVGYPLPALQWFRNGENLEVLMSNLEARISISTEIHMEGDSTPFVMSQLQIIRVTSDDSGIYQCSAENGYLRSNGNFSVTVSTLPTITRGLDEVYHVQLGGRHSFECVFEGVPIPNIVWLKDTSLDLNNVDDSNLVITYPDPTSSQAKSTLTVLEVSLRYHGTYTCLATNSVGSNSSTGILSIVDRVLLNLEEPHDNMSTHGENVTFNCAVHSNLVHSLTWLHTSRNGTTAVVNGQVSQLTMTTTDMLNVTYHFLTIDSVEYSDTGNYTCVAMLGVDSISSSTYLSVTVPAEVQVHGHNTVTEFESLVISCKAVGYPLPALQWFRNGENLEVLMSNLEARISISTEIHMEGDSTPFVMSQLQIIRVTSDDSGIYQCSAENGYLRSNGNITVTVSTLPTITRGLDEVYHVQLGDRHSFECVFEGVPIPNIVWLKDTSLDLNNVDDSNLVITYPDPTSSQAKSTVTVLEVSLRYHGTYTCLATNSVGSNSSTGILSIVDRVLLNLEEPHDNMVAQGVNVTFNCAVHSNLVHSLTWLHTSRNGTTAAVNRRVSQLTMTTTDMLNVTYHFLTIDSVEYSDTGYYTCVAMLGVDSISSSRYLSVSVPAEVEVRGHSTVTEFETLVISCKAVGYPLPAVQWFRNGENLHESNFKALPSNLEARISLSTEIHMEGDTIPFVMSQLQIIRMTSDDSGIYQCSAENGYLRSNGNITVTVSIPAEVQVRGHNTVTEFETLVISCKAVGFPLPVVQWFRNGVNLDTIKSNFKPLPSNLKARISISTKLHMEGDSIPFVMSQLQIMRMTSDDSGIYQCSAENGYLRSNGNITVTVSTINECTLALARGGTNPCQNGGTCEDSVGTYYCHCAEGYAGMSCTEEVLGPSEPPMIVVPPPDTPTPLVNALNLTCGATGNPPPTYRWYRDGELLLGAVLPYFHIGETTPEDRGYYHCEVINSIDKDQSLPALVTIPGVYQYSIEVELNDSTFGILDLPAEIVFSGRSNISLYSVRLLGNYTNEQAQLLFTVLTNTHTTVGIADAITQELRTHPLNLLSEPERYDGCQARADQIAEGVSIYFSWKESEIGSHSFHPCPCKDIIEAPANATISRRCGGTYSTRGRWDEVDYNQCFTDITLKLCEAILLAAGSPQALAEIVATITNDFMSFEPRDVSVTVTLIKRLTQDAVQDPEVRVNYLDAIDNLLRANSSVIRESQMQSNTSSRLLEILTAFSDNVPLQDDSNTTIFTRHTFALLVKDVDVMGLNDETLYINLGTVEEATNTSELIDPNSLVVSTSDIANINVVTTAEVEVPQISRSSEGKLAQRRRQASDEGTPAQRVSYTVFANDSLFQSANETQSNITLGSIVVSVRMNVSNELPNPIRVTFLINMLIENASRAICAEWNTSGAGEWSNNTCTVTGRNSDSDDRTYVQAEYSRPGHFGILLDLNPSLSPSSFALQAISYIGVIVSIVCLTAFIVTYAASRNLRSSEHGQILMNMSCSLAGFYIIFMIAGHAAPVAVLCGISAALLQYFMLVYFGWTAAEAVYLYIKLVKVLGTNISRYVLKAALIVWLVPLLIVAVSAGAGYNYYDIRQILYCRAEQYPFWFGLVLPFGVIYVFNWVIFFLIMRSVFKLNKQSVNPNKKETKKKAFIAIGLATVLGLGWGFGLLATSSDLRGLTLAFQIIFSIFVGCQGLLLFILHGLRSVEARKEWKLWFSTVSNKSVQLYTDARSMSLPRTKRSSDPTSPVSSVYEMSYISKGSTLPRARKASEDEMEVSAKEKQTNESLQMPPISKDPVVAIVFDSSAEDQIDHATSEATTPGDQQQNEVTGRSDKYDLANKSESPSPAQRERDIEEQSGHPILPDDMNPTSPLSSVYGVSDVSKGSTLPEATKASEEASAEEKQTPETNESLQMPPISTKEPFVTIVFDSSDEDHIGRATPKVTTPGDQQQNEVTGRSDKYDLANKSESPPPAQRERDIKELSGHPILPDDMNPTSPLSSVYEVSDVSKESMLPEATQASEDEMEVSAKEKQTPEANESLKMPPISTKEHVVTIVFDSSAEVHATSETTPPGDQQQNEVAGRSDKCDLASKSESPSPAQRESDLKEQSGHPILPKSPDDTNPEES